MSVSAFCLALYVGVFQVVSANYDESEVAKYAEDYKQAIETINDYVKELLDVPESVTLPSHSPEQIDDTGADGTIHRVLSALNRNVPQLFTRKLMTLASGVPRMLKDVFDNWFLVFRTDNWFLKETNSVDSGGEMPVLE